MVTKPLRHFVVGSSVMVSKGSKRLLSGLRLMSRLMSAGGNFFRRRSRGIFNNRPGDQQAQNASSIRLDYAKRQAVSLENLSRDGNPPQRFRQQPGDRRCVSRFF